MINPGDTWALVIGIDAYPKLGEGWPLAGPALDAIRFTNWLLDRKVPATQIRLCLSTNERAAVLAQLRERVDDRGATREEILNVLENEVATWRGKLLFVYWGGHGTIDSIEVEEPRRLFFGDASEDSPRSLSVPGLLAMLSRKRTGDIPQQAIFIDACATFQARARFKVEVPPSSPAFGQVQDPVVRQFRFYASRRGEAAIDLKADRTGAFSQELRKALEDAPKDQWPPNLADVARTVQAAFEEMRQSGRGMQTPILDGNDWDGNVIGDTTSAFARRKRSLGDLRVHIDRLPMSTAEVLSLFRATFPASPKLVDIRIRDDVFDFLIGTPPAKSRDSNWPSELEFAERIRRHLREDRKLDPSELRGLATWIEGFSQGPLRDLYDALRNEEWQTMRYLVIELAPAPTPEGVRVEQAWLYREGRAAFYHPWTREELAVHDSDVGRIQRVINDTASFGPGPFAIEFVVPKRHLANSPYAWPVSEFEEQLGSVYPVVVRWRERLAEPASVRNGRWRPTAERLFQSLIARDDTRVEWLPSKIPDPEKFWKALDKGEYGDLLMVGHLGANFEPGHPVMYALAGGATAVCWWLEPPADPQSARVALEQLLKTRSPTELAKVLHEGRQSDEPERKSLCSATVLFWDHLARNPYGVG